MGLGLGRDRQRKRVVDGDFIAVNADRDRLARVVAVDRQVLLLVGRDRCCGVFGSDGDVFRHIIRDLGRGVLQVVVNRDRSLIQLEVDLQNGAAVAGDRCAPSLVFAFIKDVLRRFVRLLVIARHLNRSVGRSFTRLVLAGGIGGIYTGVILIIELNGVLDVSGFPHSEHGVIRCMLICRHMRCYSGQLTIRVELAVFRIIEDERRNAALRPVARITLPSRRVIRRIADLYAGPALELIADFSLCGLNLNSLIDLEIAGSLVGVERSCAVVLEPTDMGEDFLLPLNINSIDLNDVGIRIAFFRLSYDIAFSIHDFGVCHQHIEEIAGEDRFVKNKCSAIPLLDFPVAEDIIAIIRYGSANGYRARIIRILVSICAAGAVNCGAVIYFIDRIVNHIDAVSADEFAAPLGIQVQLTDGVGPIGIDFRIGIKLAIGADRLFVDTVSIKAVGMR